ncbi:MAG: EI24 domain-containing protein, partial [Thermodesulfobacteriota bacterium]
VLILFSPVLSYISEVTESRVYGTAGPTFSLRTLLQDLWRSILINLRNLARMVVLVLLAWLLVLLPLIGAVISASLIFLIQAYYNGFALMDYTLERKRFSVKDSVRFARSNRPRVIGVGIGFMSMMLIPVLGWFAAPTYGTVAATLGALDRIDRPLSK